MNKLIFYTIILSNILTAFACNMRNKNNNPQFAINLENQKKEVMDQLALAHMNGYIDGGAYKLMTDQLVGDCDSCLLSEEALSCTQIDSMVVKALDRFEDIKMNQEVIGIVALHYSIIASSNQSRNIFRIGEYCNPGAIIWPWFEARQSIGDKYNDVRNRVKTFQGYSFDKISKEKTEEIAQRAYNDIDRLETDSLLTDEQVRDIINASLNASIAPEMEMRYTHEVANIYFALATIKNVDNSDIKEYFLNEDNNPEMKPIPDEELKPYVAERLNWMVEEGLINKRDYTSLKTHMLEDIDAFLTGTETEKQLFERASNSLKKLGNLKLDTEDREFVAETYYDMAKRRGINIADMVNLWLYGEEVMGATYNHKN